MDGNLLDLPINKLNLLQSNEIKNIIDLTNESQTDIPAATDKVIPDTSADQELSSTLPAPTNVQCYQELLDLEELGYVPNYQPFECPVCLVQYDCIEGVTLRNCLHTFCKDCIANTVKYSDDAEVKCPFTDTNYQCDCVMLEREIKALVSVQEYERHLQIGLRLAEHQAQNSFHCKTPNCEGWCFYEHGVNFFSCPLCNGGNCLICNVLHGGLNCQQYQNSIYLDRDSPNTALMLAELIATGEGINCPKCQILIMKRDGCDAIICPMCKMDICWVTKGPRWGPLGTGDSSGGCRCGVGGIKCHPQCNNCH